VNVIDFAHFVAQLLLAGAFIRFIQLRWPDSTVGRALGVIY
jgi:hypothetical protein